MRWYYEQAGGHTHVRVFMNGGKCGDLCFRNEEFAFLHHTIPQSCIEFIPDIPKKYRMPQVGEVEPEVPNG
jgi:hypothetical protein